MSKSGNVGGSAGTAGFATASQPSAATQARAAKDPAFWGFLGRFPRAALEIARISRSGTIKHEVPISDMSFLNQPIESFDDAVVRHQVKQVIEGPRNLDPKDHTGYSQGHLHRGHLAWNALAALEKELYEMEKLVTPLTSLPAGWNGQPGGITKIS